MVDWVDFLSIISWPWLAKIWAIKITWELQKSLSVGGWVDFLIIVSAPGPGRPNFGQCQSKGHVRQCQGQELDNIPERMYDL